MPRSNKEYIFGMLFLKRLSDLVDQEREQLAKELATKGVAGRETAPAWKAFWLAASVVNPASSSPAELAEAETKNSRRESSVMEDFRLVESGQARNSRS